MWPRERLTPAKIASFRAIPCRYNEIRPSGCSKKGLSCPKLLLIPQIASPGALLAPMPPRPLRSARCLYLLSRPKDR
jgi:hypothetical protein